MNGMRIEAGGEVDEEEDGEATEGEAMRGMTIPAKEDSRM
jgi:hypothetical protein